MRFVIAATLSAFFALPALGQNTVTLTPSVTSSAAGATVVDLTWSSAPVAPGCVASGHPGFAVAKPGEGSVSGLQFTADSRLVLTCTWPGAGAGAVTITFIPDPLNADGTPYTDRLLTRLKWTYGASLTSGGPETCPTEGPDFFVDLDDTLTPRPSTHTIATTQAGTLRARAWHINAAGLAGAISNAATKVVSATGGGAAVTESVQITVHSRPGRPTNLAIQ